MEQSKHILIFLFSVFREYNIFSVSNIFNIYVMHCSHSSCLGNSSVLMMNCCDLTKNGKLFSAKILDGDKVDWKTLSISKLVDGNEASDEQESITIRKLTKQHEAVILARNHMYNVSAIILTSNKYIYSNIYISFK